MTGRVVRVNGPLVEVEGLADVAVLDVIEVGPARLAAEAVAVLPDLVTAEVYEYTGGLRVGDPAEATHAPLLASLGPGLLGVVFDGLLRSLPDLPTWLTPGSTPSDADPRWVFAPRRERGGPVAPGDLLGVVETRGGIEHRVLVPPDGPEGPLEWIAGPGGVGATEPVAVVGGQDVTIGQRWPVRRPRPVRSRFEPGEPLLTGQRVIDLLVPVSKGGTAAVPGGFGTGKTMLLQQVLKCAEADVIVFVGCGERGNELADSITDLATQTDPATGRPLGERTVVIANTSNMPVMAREASIHTGMTVAEFYRDMGYDVVLIADSTSRWAEALREFSSRRGELPAEEGYPAGLGSALAGFYERAGRVTTLAGTPGSVTAIGAVSPAGGDMTEPVAAHTERFVRCLWSLDRGLAYARHYPAVSWRRSFSRDAAAVGEWHHRSGRPSWAADRQRAVELLAGADRLEALVELVGLAALSARDRMVVLAARLLRQAVLQQSATSANDVSCSVGKQSALLRAVLDVFDRCQAATGRGVAADAVEEVDFSSLLRARDELGPSDEDGVLRRARKILARLDGLP